MVFARPLLAPQLDQLSEVASAVRADRVGSHGVRLVVTDAGEVSPRVTEWAAQAGVEVESVEPYLPPFDDVFVELVSNLTGGNGNGHADAGRGDSEKASAQVPGERAGDE